MPADAQSFLWFSLFFAALFASAETIFRLTKVKAEYTRKYVHVGSGLICFAFPLYFSSHWWVLAICAAFLLLLATSLKLPRLLPSINAVGRFTTGSLLYPVAVYVSFLACTLLQHESYFYMPMAVMAIADPVAALAGGKWARKQFTVLGEKKSWLGSLAFFMTALVVISIVGFLVFNEMPVVPGHPVLIRTVWWVGCIFVAGTATVAEAIGIKGTDNITIPLSVIASLALIEIMVSPYHL